MRRISGLIVVLFTLLPAVAQAATYNVSDETEFDTALSMLACGDVVELAAGATFVGDSHLGFVLPNVGDCSANPITITTDADPSNLPAEGYRITPAYEAFLPKLHAYHEPTDKFAQAMNLAPGANGYILRFLEFQPGYRGVGVMLSVGQQDEQFQYLLSHQPANIILDRIYINGNGSTSDPYARSSRGIYLGGINITLKDSYCHGVEAAIYDPDGTFSGGRDASCLVILNGAGPYTIYGNYIEGGTETIITGGSGIGISTRATLTGTPTTTSADVSWTAWGGQGAPGDPPQVGEMISLYISSATASCNATITDYTPATSTTGTVTWSPACSAAPDVPGRATWGVQPRDLTFERNYITHDLSLLTNGLVPLPTNFSATATTGGSLADGTYNVHIYTLAWGSDDSDLLIWSMPSAAEQVVISGGGGAGRIAVSWDNVPGNAGYGVYLQHPDSSWSNIATSVDATSLDIDDVLPGPSSGLVSGYIPKWKNNFEIKIGDRINIRYNIIRNYVPSAGDSGYAAWIKNENQPPGCQTPYQLGREIDFSYNLLENVAGFVLITGNSYECPGTGVAPVLEDVSFTHNVVFNSNSTFSMWGLAPGAVLIANGGTDITFDHNTIDHKIHAAVQFNHDSALPDMCQGLVFTNNLLFRNEYGIIQTNSPASYMSVEDVLANECPNSTLTSNVFAGPQASSYADGTWPAGNQLPSTTAALEDEFIDYATGNLRLKSDSTLKAAGSDGLDLGADYARVLLLTAGVEEGTPAPITGGRLRLRRK